MKETDIFRLRHMLDASREALSFASGRRRIDLNDDRGLVLILVKEIEIIGEAASKVSEETRLQLPEIDWKAIVGMRNRLVHVYFDINYDILWTTVKYEIPELIRELEKVLEF